MAKKRKHRKNSLEHIFLLRRKIETENTKPKDRDEVDLEIRTALRKNESLKVHSLALRHPLRPLKISSEAIRTKLGQQGFVKIPYTKNLMLPPEGTSRREAKRIKDRLMQEHAKERRKIQKEREKKWISTPLPSEEDNFQSTLGDLFSGLFRR